MIIESRIQYYWRKIKFVGQKFSTGRVDAVQTSLVSSDVYEFAYFDQVYHLVKKYQKSPFVQQAAFDKNKYEYH